MMYVRGATLQDLPGVYRVCDETGPATTNPDLLGHIYAGPYVVGEPDLARVVVDGDGVAGYLFGCADTRAFESWCEREWWPVLREQYPVGSGGDDAELVGLIHTPERTPDDILSDYPAHLHIDLLERTRGRGYGRELIDWLCDELAARGIPGVHLGVGVDNANAIQFYSHLGFESARTEGDALLMTKRLQRV
jgi:ribosomal protein S18 acetylase RimI-like enzyme